MAEQGNNPRTAADTQDRKSCTAGQPRSRRWAVAGLHLPRLPRLSSRSRSQERGQQPPAAQEMAGPASRTRSRDLRNKISFWKRKSAAITDYDPTYRVIYLGNVLTGWAKGDGCVDKPLSTLWRNHISSDKPDIVMKMTVVGSGLRAVTKEHGLTEYWANRITYCSAHPSYPRVFCWIYRHEGRKMKQELRCHAVLCPKEDKAKQIAGHLQDRLHQALVDFKKEKISRQNARLSLANSIHENPTMPYRKLLLQTGTCNYKPPIERSKSAPKLTSIEEADMEEEFSASDDDDDECVLNTNYNIAMLQVHRNPTILLDDCSLAAGGPSYSPVFRDREEREAGAEVIRFQEAGDNTDTDEDEITDYIGSVEVHSVGSSDSPASQGRGTLSCSPRDLRDPEPGGGELLEDGDCHSLSSDQSDSGCHGDGISSSLGLIRISEQDTISDESGYSEEPIAGRAKEVTVVTVNLSEDRTPPISGSEFLGDDFESSLIGATTGHKLEITLNDSVSNNNTQASDQKLVSRPVVSSSSWCQPINIDIDKMSDSVSVTQYDSQESSPRDTVSSVSPDTAVSPHTPQLSPLSLSPDTDQDPAAAEPRPPASPRDRAVADLTVKSVFLSEFTASEKLRYLDRSNVNNPKYAAPRTPLNRQEFCINI